MTDFVFFVIILPVVAYFTVVLFLHAQKRLIDSLIIISKNIEYSFFQCSYFFQYLGKYLYKVIHNAFFYKESDILDDKDKQ